MESVYSQAQTIQIIECNVSVSPTTLRLAGNIPNVGYIDRIEEQLLQGGQDTVQVEVYFDHCGPTGCCVPYDTTFVLEHSFPFYLCVNAYLDTFSVAFPCIATNDEVELLSTQCLSPDQILSAEKLHNQSRIKLYPSPTDRFLTIELLGIDGQDLSYTIRDMNGRELLSGQIEREPFRLDLGRLSSGVFVLELRSEKGVLRRRFVKSE